MHRGQEIQKTRSTEDIYEVPRPKRSKIQGSAVSPQVTKHEWRRQNEGRGGELRESCAGVSILNTRIVSRVRTLWVDP